VDPSPLVRHLRAARLHRYRHSDGRAQNIQTAGATCLWVLKQKLLIMPFYIGSVLLHFRTRYQLVYIEIVKLVTLHSLECILA
jgi:hypothetical protein